MSEIQDFLETISKSKELREKWQKLWGEYLQGVVGLARDSGKEVTANDVEQCTAMEIVNRGRGSSDELDSQDLDNVAGGNSVNFFSSGMFFIPTSFTLAPPSSNPTGDSPCSYQPPSSDPTSSC